MDTKFPWIFQLINDFFHEEPYFHKFHSLKLNFVFGKLEPFFVRKAHREPEFIIFIAKHTDFRSIRVKIQF